MTSGEEEHTAQGNHALDWLLRRGFCNFGGFLLSWFGISLRLQNSWRQRWGGEGLTAEPREEAALDDCALDDWRGHRVPRESNGRSSEKHGGTVGMEGGWCFWVVELRS